MKLKLDHIVHFIDRQPHEAVEKLKAEGIYASMGGRHPLWGTFNSVAYFQSSYIEFLAVEDASIAVSSDNPLIQQLTKGVKKGERIGQICFRTDHIQALQEKFTENGLNSVIHEGRRTRNDGKLIQWKMLFLEGDSSLPFPFFIEWEEEDEERFRGLKDAGLLLPSQEKYAAETIKILTSNKERTAASWAKVFAGTPAVQRMAEGEPVIVLAGDCKLEFTEPYSELTKSIFSKFGDTIWKVNYHPRLKDEEIHIFGGIYQ